MWFPAWLLLVLVSVLVPCQAGPKFLLIETKDKGIIYKHLQAFLLKLSVIFAKMRLIYVHI
jgi:hypothetical protein